MLPREFRLDDKRLIARISQKGRVWRTSVGQWRFVPSPTLKLTVVISKKQLKLAVDRNRVKRRIRALMMQDLSKLPKIAAIFYINKAVLKMDATQLKQEWERCLLNWPKA